jgi:hypothetical protein
MSGLQILSIPFVAGVVFLLMLPAEWGRKAPAPEPAREPTAIETWWSEHYGRVSAERACLKESLLASNQRLYLQLCLEEKGFAE